MKRLTAPIIPTTACDLLKNTDLPYIEIAYSLGFSTQSMFIRIFKAETELTPKQYREKYYVWE
ncbi:MAG: AraC family transcriptional regulator [Oscillospiraceae bacterium]|nr:AraC family transcriptional regulator [Oscillospiraceae bacterium]MDY6207758.1 AraC family transcriptional regulator [Oscillospiraceae bacterium]